MCVIIQSTTGDLLFGNEWVGPALREAEFLRSALGRSATIVRQGAAGNIYSILFPEDSGRELSVIFKFSGTGGMEQARVKFVKPEIRAQGAAGWSKEAENEMKAFHDEWLRERLGDPPHDFPWGWVSSIIDDHDYSAVIIVVYGRKRKFAVVKK